MPITRTRRVEKHSNQNKQHISRNDRMQTRVGVIAKLYINPSIKKIDETEGNTNGIRMQLFRAIHFE